MKLSRKSHYGLVGLIVLARQPLGSVMTVREIAEAGRLPSGFLAQIFLQLRRQRVVVGNRGAARGYSLARPPDQISLREIFEAVEGPDLFGRCIFWSGLCEGQDPCTIHHLWAQTRPLIQGLMERTTLAQVVSLPRSPGRRVNREVAVGRGRRGGTEAAPPQAVKPSEPGPPPGGLP
ncbi:MAG: RrF2 family transcriptional regulator [Candidatus Methylomirabilales bacterium]